MRFPNRFAAFCSGLLLFGLALSAATDGAYRVQPGDTLDVRYRVTPEFDSSPVVQPDGSVSLPLIGRIDISGMTTDQVAGLIRAKASERLRDPEVAVLIRDFTKPTYTVAGEVGKPGTFDLRGEVTLMRAVAAAGWFKETSKHSQVLLIRRVDREWGEARAFNLRKEISSKSFTEDPVIKPGDLIVVPQNTLSKLDRYFRWASFANLGFLLR